MSSIDTTLPVFAVLLITLAGVSALPWSRREVADSVWAFRGAAVLVRDWVGRMRGVRWVPTTALAPSSSPSR